MSKHHIVPRLHGGKDGGNIVVLPKCFHRAIHTVFQGLHPDDYQEFLNIVMTPGSEWTTKDLHTLRKRLNNRRKK